MARYRVKHKGEEEEIWEGLEKPRNGKTLEYITEIDPIKPALKIADLRMLLLTHPDQDMVLRSCLHYLGDATEEFYNKLKSK